MYSTDVEQRFYTHVRKSSDDHWYWTLYTNPDGYGRTSVRKRSGEFAHRVAWELANGPIPDGMVTDHLCGTRSCVNPGHLEMVTPTENQRRSRAKITHCPQGHRYTGETNNRGHRICRECLSEASKRYHAKKRRNNENT